MHYINSRIRDKEVFTKKETRPSSEVRTNTKNTTETTTKTTTTAQARDVVEKAEEIFAPLKCDRLVNLVCERGLSKAAPDPSGNESL